MSSYGVMRGLHFQRPPFTQSKLVRCVKCRVITSITLKMMGVSLSWLILFVLIGAFLWNMLIFWKRIRNMMRCSDIHTGKLAQQFLHQLCRGEHSYREADCQSVSRLWRNGSVLYRQVGWWCHHELYPAKAGAAGLCHPHLCCHTDCGGM